MSRPATGEPDRGVEAPTRTTRTRDAASAILIVLALGLAFRLILAYLLPGSGFAQDLSAFRFWASNLAAEGPFGFYERPFFHDYTPGYLYVLWLIGLVGQAVGGIGDLIKLPAIIADLVIAWLVWSMVQELGGSRRAALLGAGIVVVNPITWFDSVVWGQVDSVGVVFLLLALRELWRDRPERSAVLAVMAAIVKPQLGIIVPLVAAITIRRALWPVGAYGDERSPGAAAPRSTTTAWERRTTGPLRIVTTGVTGLLTAVVLSAPFGLSIIGLIEQIGVAAGGYPYLTVNAYNAWAVMPSTTGHSLAANGVWVCDVAGVGDCMTGIGMIGPLPGLAVGTALMLLAIVAVSVAVAWRPDRRTMLVGLAVLAIVFFAVPTRVHERYLFPFFGLAAILAAVSVRWRIAYVLVSLATFANMYVVLTTLYPGNPSIQDWLGVGEQIRSFPSVALIAAVHTAALGWAGLQLLRGRSRRLAEEIQASHGPPPGTEGVPVPLSGPGWLRRRARGAPVRPMATVSSRRARPPSGAATIEGGRSFAEAGTLGWLRGRLGERPVRPDRTALLAGEPGGRVDRLDIWIVVVLVLAVLTIRIWRLEEPHQMHFDEVYHARTATEFLQHWRYGESHDIYEWTHPHFAKYAIAGGIIAFGDDRVSATSNLGVSVRDAAVEPRREDAGNPGRRVGDRLHVATGSELRSYDLETRELVASVPIDGAAAVTVDRSGGRVWVGTDDGAIVAVETFGLDGGGRTVVEPVRLTTVDGAVERVQVTDDGRSLVAVLEGDVVVMLDAVTGAATGSIPLPGAGQMADAGRSPAVVANLAEVVDPTALADTLAALLGGDAQRYGALLASDAAEVVLHALLPSDDRAAVDAAMADGELPGVGVEERPRVAIAEAEGVTFVLPAAGQALEPLRFNGGVTGLALVTGVDDPKLYLAIDAPDGPKAGVVTLSGSSATDKPSITRTFPLPGRGSLVAYNEASRQVHVLGEPPAEGRLGAAARDAPATVYVIEPHANAVYADAELPVAPVALAMDANELYPTASRQQLLALGSDGTVASVETGKHAFAWRLPGVIAGALMAVLLYLLARILFRRRFVAITAGLLVLVDGMFFVQSRIAMNDAYVGLFLVAAVTLFAAIWTGYWRSRWAFWAAMPVIGLLLGLGLASKWVAAYAIGALGILILTRSALGRLVLLAGMIVVTTALGYMAVSVPEGQGTGNLTFLLLMIGLTLVTVVVIVLHPIEWTFDELRIAVGAPAAAGVAIVLGALALGRLDTPITVSRVSVTPLHAGFAFVVLALLVAGAFWLAGRFGFGPLAPPAPADDPARLLEPPAPAPEGWLRPGSAFGLPVAWMLVCLLALPVAVYVASYVPWAMVENHRITDTWPPGHTGQTLVDLTGQMYRYHNTLTAAHAASSPWWAWPFNLKPVWFYQDSFAGGTSASIYDAGNLVIWWLGVPAMLFAAWQAFKRRSLGLAMIMILFACMWIPWARIDRAAFQYHYYTSLPFVVLALAYFIGELWHGASRRTWLLARAAAALAIVAPAAMWLLHRPLCAFVGVESVNPGSQACPTLIPDFVLTARAAALAIVVAVAVVVLVRQLASISRPDEQADDGPEPRSALSTFRPMLLSAVVAAVGLAIASTQFAETPIVTLQSVAVEPVAILVGIPLVLIAAFVLTARDARRFVLGAFVAIVGAFVLVYPNIAALPLPSAIVNAYQGLLPTYVYPFQFPVSTVDRNVAGPSLLSAGPAILLVALTATCLVVAYSTWVWRITLAERRLAASEGTDVLAPSGGDA